MRIKIINQNNRQKDPRFCKYSVFHKNDELTYSFCFPYSEHNPGNELKSFLASLNYSETIDIVKEKN